MPNQSVDLVVAGTIGLDDVTTPFGAVTATLGGSASYAAIAASYFARPGVVSIAGTDWPSEQRRELTERGIDLAGVTVSGQTFRWQGVYEFDMNEATTLRTELNALADFAPTVPSNYREATVLLLANLDPSLQALVARALPQTFKILDTMNFWISSQRAALIEAIRLVDVLVLNEAEARQLCDEVNLVKAARELRSLGPTYVMIKQGEHGALLFGHETCFTAPGYPLEALKDPTGAGDSFAGAVAGFLATQPGRDEPTLRRAVIYGSTLASFCTEAFSVERTIHLTEADIEERYDAFKTLSQF